MFEEGYISVMTSVHGRFMPVFLYQLCNVSVNLILEFFCYQFAVKKLCINERNRLQKRTLFIKFFNVYASPVLNRALNENTCKLFI
jgi:uncharacterized membrane protein